jgi:NADPH2:quinone reductase
MRAVWVDEYKPFEELTLAEVSTPDIGPRQVRIRTQAAGISFADTLFVSGRYQRKPPLPFVPGYEIAGTVAEVGAAVSLFKPGDRVAGSIDWGAMAEEAVALEVNLHALPDAIGFPEAIYATGALTACAAQTWPHLLNVQAGDWLLVHGAAGGVGLPAVEVGKRLGARVIATASTDAKLAAVLEHGADHAINYAQENFRDRVLEITEGQGVDKVFDPVGGDVFLQSLRCMAPEGRICAIGFASGEIPQIPANILLVKNLTVCGANFGYYVGWSPDDVRYQYEARMRALTSQVYEWCVDGALRPQISSVYSLEQFQDAMRAVMDRSVIGRVVLVMGDEARKHGF